MAILADIEETGVDLDVAYLERMSGELAGDACALESEIYELAGERFNINSPRQLGVILFDKLSLPVYHPLQLLGTPPWGFLIYITRIPLCFFCSVLP